MKKTPLAAARADPHMPLHQAFPLQTFPLSLQTEHLRKDQPAFPPGCQDGLSPQPPAAFLGHLQWDDWGMWLFGYSWCALRHESQSSYYLSLAFRNFTPFYLLRNNLFSSTYRVKIPSFHISFDGLSVLLPMTLILIQGSLLKTVGQL